MSDVERIQVQCQGAARINVPRTALGKKARSPKCQRMFVLRAAGADEAVPERARPSQAGGRGGDLLTAILDRYAWWLIGKPNRAGGSLR